MKSMRMRWAGYVASMEGKRNGFKIFGGKTRRKKSTRKT
jgi:hypothetical protein